MKQKINELTRMQKLAGLLTENEGEDIASFLNNNIEEVKKLLHQKFEGSEIKGWENLNFSGGNIPNVADDNIDAGVSFSFDKDSLLLDDEADETITSLNIAGKPVWMVSYNV